MHRFIVLFVVFIELITLSVCVTPEKSPAERIMESAYWKHRTDLFRTLPNPEGEICFLGDSITEGCDWIELIGNCKVTNRGINSDTTWGLMARIDEVTEGKPAMIFLMIGTNDLAWGGKTVPEVRDKIAELLDTIKEESPETEIYLQSVLPVIDGRASKFENKNIELLNVELEKLAASRRISWVNLAPFFKDKKGQLKKEFTTDGLHLNGRAYYKWYSAIRKYLKSR